MKPKHFSNFRLSDRFFSMKEIRVLTLLSLAVSIASMLAIQPAGAATYYFDVNGATAGSGAGAGGIYNWLTDPNWSTDGTGSSTTSAQPFTYTAHASDGNNAVFVAGADAGANAFTVNVNGFSAVHDIDVNSGNLTINTQNNNWVLNGTGDTATWTVATGASLSVVGSLGFTSGALNMDGNSLVVNTQGTGIATIGGMGNSGGGMTKSGTGTLTLSAASNYTSATIVNSGTLKIGVRNGLTSGSAITVVGGATLSMTAASNNTLAVNTGLTLNGGTLTAGTGSSVAYYGNYHLDTSGSITVGANTGTSNISGSLSLNGRDIYNDNGGFSSLTVNDNSTLVVSGNIGGVYGVSWGGLSKYGNGTLKLTGQNGGVNGGMFITAGSVEFGPNGLGLRNASYPHAAYAADFEGNATLRWAAGNTQDISGNGGNAAYSSSQMKIADGVTATLDTNGNNVTLGTAIILGANKTGALTKTGTGTLTLSVANTYSGVTTIHAGVLNAAAGDGTGNGALGNGGNIIFTGGILQYSATSAGTDYASRVKHSTSAIAIDTNGQTVTWAGNIDSTNTGGLVKSGSGVLTLSGSNAYTGNTVVAAGTLRLAPTSVPPAGLKIMPLGDSITFGSGGTQSGYRGFLYSLLSPVASGFQFVGSSTLNATSALPTSPTDQTHHDGHPSATIQYISNNLDGFDDSNLYHGALWSNTGGYWFTGNNGTGRPPLYPDIITLMIGTNGDSSTPAPIDALVAKITGMRPNANLIVADITPNPNPASTYNSYVDAVVSKYAAMGRHVTRVDLSTGFPANGLTSDNVHPNDTGYAFMANQWNKAILALYPGNAMGIGSQSPVSIASGATLDINGSRASLGIISGEGNITLGTNGQLTVNGTPGSNNTISGVISGTGNLTFAGGGMWTLSGSNSYVGATVVDSGTLTLDGVIAAGGSVTVSSGATLAGSGRIDAATTVNGAHSPGDGVGSQTFTGALAYGSSSRLKWELAGNSSNGAGTNFDQVIASNVTVTPGAAIDLVLKGAGGTVNFTDAFWRTSQSWTVVVGTSINGQFALGTISTDAEGNAAATYGTFALQQSVGAITLTWTPLAPIEVWRNLIFGENAMNPTISGDLVDVSHDGIPNLIAYAMGLNPNTFNSLPGAGIENGFLALTYTRSKAATDVTLSVEWSANLIDWVDSGIVETMISDDGINQTISAQVQAVPDKTKFLHIKVAKQ